MAHAPTIDTDELKAALDAGTVRVVEVLLPWDYDKGHIPGAIHIYFGMLGRRAAEYLSKDDAIVTYCHDETCRASRIAADKLIALGYANARHYPGGKRAWREAGHPLEVSETPTEG